MPHAPIPLIVGHFTEAGKVNNKSLRKLYTCNHCTDNPALVLQHRDNVLLEHLTESESDAGPSKKCRGGTIHSWVDHALTPEQQNSADIKFFQ